jgi:phosphoglycolate phosphatase
MKSIWPHLEGKTHVIWDWNGTLLNDVDLMVEVIGDILDKHGLERVNREKYCELFRFPIREYYKLIGFDLEKVSFERLSEQFTQDYREGLSTTQLHDGVKEFLRCVTQSKISQSVLSAAQETFLHEQLKHFGVHHYFDHIYGLEDYHAVSKIERGKQLMAEAKIPKETTLLIGDTDHDLEVGDALGVEVLLLADGHQSFDRLSSKHHRILRTRY